VTGFPGAVGVTHLRVYDSQAPDGLCGGSPHLHTASAEGYVVTAGTGALQTLSGEGYAETALAPGTVLWFTPGTVHRLVNNGHDLRILVVMQNAGLPEAGDAVLTFPPDVLADPDRYAAAAAAPQDEQAAAERRDLATEGYLALRDAVLRDGPAALQPLYAAAGNLVRGNAGAWRELWRRGALAQAQATGAHLDALAAGDSRHLASAAVTVASTGDHERFGMCGWLSRAVGPVELSTTARSPQELDHLNQGANR
jgi:mannose-6-phosphate isomerase-like protein (cupin superfamily)